MELHFFTSTSAWFSIKLTKTSSVMAVLSTQHRLLSSLYARQHRNQRVCIHARGHQQKCAASLPEHSNGEAASAMVTTRRESVTLGAAVLASALTPALVLRAGPAHAGVDDYNASTSPTEIVELQLGTEDNQLIFTPSTLTFTAGRVYKLHMTNPSSLTHYFTALEFADKIYTVLVLANGVEVKGAVQEVALKKGAEATWIFVPIKPGRYPLRCTVKGHTEGGMVGEIVVEAAQGSQQEASKNKKKAK